MCVLRINKLVSFSFTIVYVSCLNHTTFLVNLFTSGTKSVLTMSLFLLFVLRHFGEESQNLDTRGIDGQYPGSEMKTAACTDRSRRIFRALKKNSKLCTSTTNSKNESSGGSCNNKFHYGNQWISCKNKFHYAWFLHVHRHISIFHTIVFVQWKQEDEWWMGRHVFLANEARRFWFANVQHVVINNSHKKIKIPHETV